PIASCCRPRNFRWRWRNRSGTPKSFTSSERARSASRTAALKTLFSNGSSMADTARTRRRAGTAAGEQRVPSPPPLLPVCDTVSGRKAASDPAGTAGPYEKLAGQLWLPPRVQLLADGILKELRGGRTRLASISGPYGYGKTAAGIGVWRYARAQGFTAIPPL